MTTHHQTGEEPRPPEAPEIDRRVTFRASHAVGLALLLLIVIPALAGLFDIKTAEHRQTIGDADVVVTYPTRIRIGTTGILEIRLNGASTDSLRIDLDDAYFESFGSYTSVDFLPTVWRLEFEAVRIGRASGRLDVSIGDAAASFDLQTTILP